MQDKVATRQVVLSLVMFGIGLTFAITGRDPGWQLFAAVCMLALITQLVALSKQNAISRWLGLLTLAVLMLGILWDTNKPQGMILSVALVILRALSMGALTNTKKDLQAVNGEKQVI